MSADPDFTPLKALSDSLAGLAASAASSVVSVHSHRALSSGFAWKPHLIITADEALADEGEVAVTLPSGKREQATIVGRDATTDIALLRIAAGDLGLAALDDVVPATGALAITIGGQAGQPAAAWGLVAVSGPAWRSMRGGDITARIELDQSLRRHAEGGLVFGASGRAFGMAVFGPRRRVLVIPTATIARVATQLEAHGRVARGYLGLGLQPVRLDRDGGVGAMVMSVDREGPGAKAGIHQGDIIASWDGHPITSLGALLRSLGPSSIGRTISLSLHRSGQVVAAEVVIAERPAA
jgi:S1-C subfamily serine protease